MIRIARFLCALALVGVNGCAGGWRSGQAPAGYAPPSDAHWTVSPDDAAVWQTNPGTFLTTAAATPAAAAVAATPATATKPKSGGTQAVADGAMFRFAGSATSVHVAGEFNAWSTSADAMTKDADGAWTLHKVLAPGRYAYKFVVNGTDWKPDDAAPESVDDGFGGKNSVVVVTGTDAPAAPPAPAAAPAAAGAATTAVADGAMFRFKGAGSSVNVAGEFNAWSTSADPMTKDASGVWTLHKTLTPGRYAYKFVVNGTDWKPDDGAAESVDDGFGGKNSVVVVTGTAAPAPAAPAPAAAAPAAGGATTTAVADGAMFRFKGAGNSVNVAGEFNAWSTSADAMTRDANGVWTLHKTLAPGRYAYKFVVNGTDWKPDDAAAESVDDGFGGKNSVVVVTGTGTAAPAQSAAPAAAAPASTKVGAGRAPELTAQGVRFTFGGMPARSVSVAGDFNDWAPNLDPMVQQPDGSWTLVKKLAPGSHTYKFVVDGSTWKRDEQNPATADDGLGGQNSVIVVK